MCLSVCPTFLKDMLSKTAARINSIFRHHIAYSKPVFVELLHFFHRMHYVREYCFGANGVDHLFISTKELLYHFIRRGKQLVDSICF